MSVKLNQRITLVQVVKASVDAEISTYICISGDYQILSIPRADMMIALNNKSLEFTNLGLTKAGIVSTNGAISNYAEFILDAGKFSKRPAAVILERTEVNGKLSGYGIYIPGEGVSTVTVAGAVDVYDKIGFANGKIRQTQQGKTISAIGGNFPLREISLPKPNEDDLDVQILFMAKAIKGSESVSYGGAFIGGKSALALREALNKLTAENKKIMAEVVRLGANEKTAKSFQIIPTGNAGFYGVFSYGSLLKLSSGKMVKGSKAAETNGVMVSVLDYSDGGDESYVEIGHDLVAANLSKGSKAGTTELRSFIEKINRDFKKV